MTEPRTIRLRKWMTSCNVTYRWIGEQLGISNTAARNLLVKDTVPIRRHQQFVNIGIPRDLLPLAMDIPTGPRPKQPIFTGLMTAQLEA